MKHVCAWAPKTQQIILVSDLYFDEAEQGAKLLVDHPIDLSQLSSTPKRKAPTGEPKPRKRPRKIVATAPTPVLDLVLPSTESGEPEGPAKTGSSNEATTTSAEKIMSATGADSKVYGPST